MDDQVHPAITCLPRPPPRPLADVLTPCEQGNRAIKGGAAIYSLFEAVVTVIGRAHFEDNGSLGNGGAIYAGIASELRLEGSASFLRNWAVYGGAIALHDRSYMINMINTGNSRFGANHVSKEWSSYSFGGAIYDEDSELILKGRTLFLGNSASSYGGAFYATPWVYSGIVEMSGNVVFMGNTASIRGGAFMATDSVVVVNGSDGNLVNFTANRAYGGEEYGTSYGY